jgi:hypothetical protein
VPRSWGATAIDPAFLAVRSRTVRTSPAGNGDRGLATDAAAASTAVVKPQSRLMLIRGPASDEMCPIYLRRGSFIRAVAPSANDREMSGG